jgi:sigma-B regulation protein RsbU (phosphoserine phosphatase)
VSSDSAADVLGSVGTSAEPARIAVRDIMTSDPVFTPPDASVTQAAALMSARNTGAVVVCERGQIVGILTERDLLRAAGRGHRFEGVPVAELMTRSPIVVGVDETWATAADLMVGRGVRHLPVVENGRLVGMISMRNLMEHRSRYLESLVQQRTAELEDKNAALEARDRLMQFHLDVAGRIQRQLLPASPPELPSFAFALAYHPLERVSGDYYDFAMLSSGRLGILLADASGHSVPAAFVSVMAKTAFHAYAQGIESPAAVLSTMNERLSNLMEAEHFITMFYGVLDRHSLRLAYALAGHPRPLWHQKTNRHVQALDAEGPAIGLMPEAVFEERSVQLSPGDLVLLYTDGVTECRNANGEQFGQQRLEAFLRIHGSVPEAGVIALLDAELNRFRSVEPFHDDVTCIGVGVQG